MHYKLQNITNRSSLTESSERRSILIDGSLVRPERTIRFSEPTEDVCYYLDEGSILVEKPNGRVIRRPSDFVDYEITRVSENVTERTVDGNKVTERVSYDIKPVSQDSEPSEASVETDDSGDQDAEEDVSRETSSEDSGEEGASESLDEDNAEEDAEIESNEADTDADESTTDESIEEDRPEKDQSEESQSEDSQPEEDAPLVDQLEEKGIESSSDLNLDQLEPLVEKRGDELPESFFEGDGRKGTQSIIDEHYNG